MDRYRIALTAENFSALVNREELVLNVKPVGGKKAEVRIILQDIGYEYMEEVIEQAQEKIEFDDDSEDDTDYYSRGENRQRYQEHSHFTDAHNYFYEAFFNRAQIKIVDLVLINGVYYDPLDVGRSVHFCRRCKIFEVQNHDGVCKNCLLRLP